jgi:hypothetical protein
MKLIAALMVLALGCGDEGGRPKGKRDVSDPDFDPLEDIGDGPQQADEGSVWRCTLTGEGDNGATWVEFEDIHEFCFEDLDAASEFVNDWARDCADAFEADGFFYYDCNADCDDLEEDC